MRLLLLPVALLTALVLGSAFVVAAPLDRASAIYWSGIGFPFLFAACIVFTYYTERIRVAFSGLVALCMLGAALIATS